MLPDLGGMCCWAEIRLIRSYVPYQLALCISFLCLATSLSASRLESSGFSHICVVYIFMLGYMWMYLCVKLLMPWADFASLPWLFPIFIEVGSFNWTWTLPVSVDLVISLLWGSLNSAFHMLEWQMIFHAYLAFVCVLWFQTPVLMLVWQALYAPSHLLCP